MPSVDDRVVQLTFENAKFEKGVSTSMNTLDKLDAKIKSGVSGTALLTLGEAAEKVAGNFSVMQAAAFTAVQRITNEVITSAKRIISAVPQQIINGGKTRALNIEQAKFQLSGLNVLWEDIYDNIDKAVSGTAYGLDEAAKVASQLVASGVAYGDANSDMAHALRGISGVAAMTNSSYEEIGSIFTTVAGQGKLMTMQLRQLEARGLNVAAKLGEQMGKSEETIRDMVTKGKIDFLTFANAMDEAFGEHATKANETFTGALSNMKAALSRIGADFATPILTHSRKILNSLRLLFNGVRSLTRPFADNTFTDAFENITTKISASIDKITDAISNVTSSRSFKYLTDFLSKKKYEMPTLSVGSSGKEVEELQWKLQKFFKDELGETFDWVPDGIFGEKTELLLKDFQDMNSIAMSGITDMNTWVALLGETEEDLSNSIHNELPTLFYGSVNDSVTLLQRLLKENMEGIEWDPDGSFGVKTEQAVKDFQQMNGLVQTGVANLETWAALFGETKQDLLSGIHNEFPNLLYGDANDKVREVQEKLTELHLWEYQADGIFGQHTRDAIVDFQKNNDLVATGLVNLETWAALLGKSKQELIAEYDAEIAPMQRVINTVMYLIDSLQMAWFNIKSAFGSIGKAAERAWQSIFPKDTVSLLGLITNGVIKFSDGIVGLTDRFNNFVSAHPYTLQKIFSGLFSIFNIGKQVVEGLARGIQKLLSPLASLGNVFSGKFGKSVKEFVLNISDALVRFNSFLEETDFFGQTFEQIADWIFAAKDAIVLFFSELGRRASESEQFQNFVAKWQEFTQSIQTLGTHVWEQILDLWGKLNEQAEKLGLTLPEIAAGGLMEGLLNALDWVFDKLTKIIDFVSPAIDWIETKFSGLFTVLGSINLSNLIGGSGPLFGVSFSEVFGTPTEIVNNFLNSVFSLFGAAKDTISPIIGSAVENTSEFVSSLDALAPAVETVTGVIESAKGTAESVADTIEVVGDAIDGVKNAASNASEFIEPIIDATENATEAIGRYAGSSRKAFAPNRSASAQRRAMAQQAQDVKTVGEAVAEAADSVGEAVKNKSIFTKVLDILSGFVPGLGLLRSGIEAGKGIGQSDSGKALASSFMSWFESGGLMDALLSAWTWFKRVGGNFLEFIASMDHGEIYAVISGIMALVALKGLKGVFTSVSGIFTAASNVITGLSRSVENIVTSITGTMHSALKTVRRAQTAKILLGLALVIGVIVGSIWLISTIPVKDIWRSVAIVGTIAIYVAVVAGILTGMANKATATSDYKGVALLLAALGLTVIAIAGSIKILEGIKLSWSLVGKIALLAAIVTGMVFAVIAISKAGIGSIRAGIGSAIVMLSFAAAVALLAKALEVVARANFTGIGDNLVVILMALGMLALVAKTIGKGGFGKALGLTLMIADIWLIVWALQSLAKVNTAQLLKAMPAFLMVIAAMGLMMAATRLAGEHAAGAGIGILAMTVSLLIVARALKKIAAIDENGLERAKYVVYMIIALYAAIIAVSETAKGGALIAAGVSFILMAVAINILYFALKNVAKLAKEDPESLDKAATIIGIFMGLFAAIEGLSAIAKPAKLIPIAIGLGLVLISIFGVFYLLKQHNIRGEEMQKQANAIVTMVEILGAVLLAVVALGSIFSYAFQNGTGGYLIGGIATAIGIIDLIAVDLVALITGIGAIMDAWNAGSALESGIDTLADISDFIEQCGETFGKVIIAFTALGAVFDLAYQTGTGGYLIGGIATALAAVDLIAVNLELILAGIGKIAGVGKNTQYIEDGITVMETIAEGLGRLGGALTNGFEQKRLEGKAENVESLAASLETASTGIQTFNDAVNELKTSSVDNIASLTDAISGMSDLGKDFKTKYATNFSEALSLYAPAIADFFTQMTSSGVNSYQASNFAQAMSHLSEIAAFGAPGTFDSDQFASFIESLRTYLTSLTSILLLLASDSFTIDESKVDAVVSSGVKIASIYDSIPETGGIIQKFFGEESLATFAGDIVRYVQAIRIVNDTLTGFEADTEAWGQFVEIGTKFSTLLDSIGYIFLQTDDPKTQNQMSALSGFIGSTSLETFADDISNYIEGIIAVNDVLVGLNEKMVYAGSMVGYIKEEKDYEWSDAWDMLVNVGQKMSELYKSLPGYMADEDAGFFERITSFLTRNKDGLSTFGQDLGDYITAMVEVNNQIVESGVTSDSFNLDVLDTVASVARTWTEIANDLSDADTSKLKTLGLSLGGADNGFMLGFQNFYDAISRMDMSIISAAITDMKTIMENLVSLASTDTTGIDDLTAVSSALADLGDTFTLAFANSFTNNAGSLIEIGSSITTSIGEGILQNAEALTAATSDVSAQGAASATERVGLYEIAAMYLIGAMIQTMSMMGPQIYAAGYALAGYGVSGASSKYTNFWYAGYYMARGVINGMKSQNNAMYYAGVDLANNALKGVTDTAVINSPSEITTQYGQYLGQGLANGMRNSEGMVADAAKDTATTALGSLNSVIAHVYDILSGALDYDFTIRPVLDLSAVREGVSEMGGMFGANRYDLGANTYVPKVAIGRNQNTESSAPTSKVELTNNFYVQRMDEGMVDYFVNRINTELGARA